MGTHGGCANSHPIIQRSCLASGWGMWMREGFIWRVLFQRSEILLVLARNTLIRVFTQESILLSLNHVHLWGKAQVMEMLILLVEISFKRRYLMSQEYSTNSYYFWEMKCLTGAKKEQSSYTGKLQQLDLTISKQDFPICYCFFVKKKPQKTPRFGSLYVAPQQYVLIF